MASVGAGRADASIGSVFGRGFGAIRDNPKTIIGLTLVLGTLPSVAHGVLQQLMTTPGLNEDQALGALVLWLGGFLMVIVLQTLLQGALVRATLAYSMGERATIGECVGAASAVLLPLIGLAVLMSLGVAAGFILLIVPGIILYVIWSVAAPALVAERVGVFEAFGRSRYLTRGFRWQVFGLEAILVIGYYVFIGMLGGMVFAVVGLNATALDAPGLAISVVAANAVLTTIASMVWSTMQAALYVELRNAKEGEPQQSLQEIFA